MDGDVVHLLQIALKALAIATVRVFEHGQPALAVAAHNGEGVFERQGVKVDGGQLVHPLFGQVALLFGVDQAALQQKIAFGIGVKNLGAIDTHLIQPGHRALADLVDRLELRDALGQVFANGGFLGAGVQGQAQQGSP